MAIRLNRLMRWKKFSITRASKFPRRYVRSQPLASAATSALLRAARELLATGTFAFTRELAAAKKIAT